MSESQNSSPFEKLLGVAGRLKFRPHRIHHPLDEKGRHELKLPESFPFMVSLFHLRAGAITQRLTWHQHLELLVPLDGPLRERMGELMVELLPGDVLVVDHLKPHQAVDDPGLNTRVLVLSFLPECVFTPVHRRPIMPSCSPSIAKSKGSGAQGPSQSTGGSRSTTPGIASGRWCKMAHHQSESSRPRHCPMGVDVGFSLRQFSAVFKIRDADGQPYVLIGGQAVNYWAERYLAVELQLQTLQPFTSEDIDFKGLKFYRALWPVSEIRPSTLFARKRVAQQPREGGLPAQGLGQR